MSSGQTKEVDDSVLSIWGITTCTCGTEAPVLEGWPRGAPRPGPARDPPPCPLGSARLCGTGLGLLPDLAFLSSYVKLEPTSS